MTIVMKRKDSGEIITLPAISVVFDGNRLFVFQDKKSSAFEIVNTRFWQLLEVCDE